MLRTETVYRDGINPEILEASKTYKVSLATAISLCHATVKKAVLCSEQTLLESAADELVQEINKITEVIAEIKEDKTPYETKVLESHENKEVGEAQPSKEGEPVVITINALDAQDLIDTLRKPEVEEDVMEPLVGLPENFEALKKAEIIEYAKHNFGLELNKSDGKDELINQVKEFVKNGIQS